MAREADATRLTRWKRVPRLLTRLTRWKRAPRLLALLSLVASCGPVSHPAGPAMDRTVVVCTQNLWNYGLPESVKRLRRPDVPLDSLRASLEKQEEALAARLSRCDLVAVQELVGDDEEARRGLDRLAQVLSRKAGRPYRARLADTRDVIRNGFLIRTEGRFREIEFVGRHSRDRLPSVRGFSKGAWDRGPAEIVVEVEGAGSGPRLRVISAHLKSKAQGNRPADPNGERWERLRVLQANALVDLARQRMKEHPGDVIVVAGDFNNVRGSATRAVLSGGLHPADLLSPRDCIGSVGEIQCPLVRSAPVLIDLADGDPDLRGRGTYRFEGREELIDGLFVSESGARLALEPGGSPADYDVWIEGRIGSGSDHRLLRVTLHY